MFRTEMRNKPNEEVIGGGNGLNFVALDYVH
jgi:hypothetical protein